MPAARADILDGACVVEAWGKYLIPGLWDMHVHPTTYVDVAYPLFIATGVTGVRDAGSDVPLETLAQWKQEIVAGTRVGPRLLVGGAIAIAGVAIILVRPSETFTKRFLVRSRL